MHQKGNYQIWVITLTMKIFFPGYFSEITAFVFKSNNTIKLLFIEYEKNFTKFYPTLEKIQTQNWYLQYEWKGP